MENDFIYQLMLTGLKEEIAKVYEKEIKPNLIKRLDEDKDKIIAGLALHVMKQAEITRQGETLRIEIKTQQL